MKVVKEILPKETKPKHYMFTCKTCRSYGGTSFSKTVFVAEYPKDFHPSLASGFYCVCPNCGTPHYNKLSARLRYLYYFGKDDTLR